MLGLEVDAAPGVVRLVDLDRVAARDQFAADAAQEMRVAVVPVGDQRVTEDHDTHAVSVGACAAIRSGLPFALRRPGDAAVRREVVVDHPLGPEVTRPGERLDGEALAQRRVIDQVRERGAQRVVVVGSDVDRRRSPHFAQARDVAEDERAARERRFENGQPERLVARRQCVDRRTREPARQRRRRQIAERMEAAGPPLATVRCCGRTGDAHRPAQLRRDRFERGEVLRGVPEAPGRQDQRLLQRRSEVVATAPVRQHHAGALVGVMLAQCSEHYPARRADEASAGETAANHLPVAVPLGGSIGPVHRAPPRQHARMRDDELRHVERQRAEGELVEMDDARPQLRGEVEQPFACGSDVAPRIAHPFEPVVALVQRQRPHARRQRALRGAEWRAHRREMDAHAACAEAACELERVVPDAAERVGGHEDAEGRVSGHRSGPERARRRPRARSRDRSAHPRRAAVPTRPRRGRPTRREARPRSSPACLRSARRRSRRTSRRRCAAQRCHACRGSVASITASRPAARFQEHARRTLAPPATSNCASA